jgi:PadR family transcriptional regulator AphA
MAIEHAILGFLNREPLTGYDLKKRFAASQVLYWSGNSSQIYSALVALHEKDLVTRTVENQESGPSRKVYTITPTGIDALKRWVLSAPDLPQLRDPLLVRLAFAETLAPDELDALLGTYETELHEHVLTLRERERRESSSRDGTPLGIHLASRIAAGWIGFFENELAWVRALHQELRDR